MWNGRNPWVSRYKKLSLWMLAVVLGLDVQCPWLSACVSKPLDLGFSGLLSALSAVGSYDGECRADQM